MKSWAAVLLIVCTSAYGKTLVVNNNIANNVTPCSTATYSTVNAAYNAANPGDTIHICPGIYRESLLVTKSNVSFVGVTAAGSSLVELEPTVPVTIADVGPNPENPDTAGVVVVQSATNVNFVGITVNGSLADGSGLNSACGTNHVGFYFANSTGSIQNSVVEFAGLDGDGSITGCQEGHGIYVNNGNGGHSYLTVTGTSIHDFDKSGIAAEQPGTTLIAKYNTVTGAGPIDITAQNGIEVNYGAYGVVNNNIITAVDYTLSSSSATGILFYQGGPNSQASNNTISETNGAVYFYQTNHGTANGNNISKSINWGALGSYQSSYTTFKSNVITGTSVEVPNQPAIYICGSKSTVTGNTINDALIGVQDDRTTADACNGSANNVISPNVYQNVGLNSQLWLDSPKAANARSIHSASYGKPSPSK
jgi:hypothetical protein